jgi:hypothetical protein
MPELSFQINDVSVMPYAAVPTLAARLLMVNARAAEPVQSVLLNCQVSIEPLGRSYTDAEESRLLDLFGERERWARTMKPLLWTIAVLKVPGFSESTDIDLPLPCTLDFDVAATKYFYGLEQGSIRCLAVFSGTVFYSQANGALQVMQIPWQSEARFQLPVEKWRAAIDAHYPDAFWLRLPRETFDRLYQYKIANHLPMWNQLMEHLLDRAESGDAANAAANPFLQPAGEVQR